VYIQEEHGEKNRIFKGGFMTEKKTAHVMYYVCMPIDEWKNLWKPGGKMIINFK